MSEPVLDLGSFGEFVASEQQPVLSELRVELLTIDLITEWQRCSNIANFLAGYLAANFDQRAAAVQVLSTVANELIENAAKFSAGPQSSIVMRALHFGDTLRIDIANVADAEHARVFAARLDELLEQDATALFVRQLSEPVSGIGRGAGIGLVILKKDYGARIAARILPHPEQDKHYQVEVQVTLTSAEIEQR